MINFDLLALWLRRYAAAWLIGFVLVLGGCLIGSGLLRVPVNAAIDVLLVLSFGLIAIAAAACFGLTLASSESGATKTAVISCGLFLLVPLFWAPVLGAISAAALGHASIEYSGVYAGFRILLGRAVWGIMRVFSENPVIELGMKLMEIFAAIVGFIAAISQLWEVMGKRGRAVGEGEA
jgi:hypothetical protein